MGWKRRRGRGWRWRFVAPPGKLHVLSFPSFFFFSFSSFLFCFPFFLRYPCLFFTLSFFHSCYISLCSYFILSPTSFLNLPFTQVSSPSLHFISFCLPLPLFSFFSLPSSPSISCSLHIFCFCSTCLELFVFLFLFHLWIKWAVCTPMFVNVITQEWSEVGELS